MIKKLIWGLLLISSIGLLAYFLFVAKIQLGGDIVEYYGITESLINHGGLQLSPKDQENLSQALNPGYFNDPTYYLLGRDGQRYPVHFILYSLLVLPFRLALELFGQNGLKALWLVNIISLFSAVFVIFRFFLKDSFKRLVLLAITFFSPLLSFLIWPGPDVFYLSLLLVATYAFFNKRYFLAVLLAAVSSWNSQPVMVIAAGFLVYYLYKQMGPVEIGKEKYLRLSGKAVAVGAGMSVLILLPYFYNLVIFGTFTPWMILGDVWTKLNGFGLQNISFQKLFEQLFDLNIGLFWYAPLICLVGFYSLFKALKKNKKIWFILALMILTAFFFQTNPAWHYGTSGYGPGRHGIFLLPFLLFFSVKLLKARLTHLPILAILIVAQAFNLYLNGFLEPDLTNTLRHSPYAEWVLDHYPQFYNPTPEIFVDRTNQTDLKYPTGAIYKTGGECKKAYVLKTEEDQLVAECSSIPEEARTDLNNEFTSVANVPRKLVTTEATLWPNPDSCTDWFSPTLDKPFICLKTELEVMEKTGMKDRGRITTLPGFPGEGNWKIKQGDPVEIIIPPGYIVHHNSLEGEYVNY